MKLAHYEADQKFSGSFRIGGWPAVAVRILGWETEPDADTEWTGIEERTGKVVAVIVGDDKKHSVDPDDLIELKRKDYCGECGQIGCQHDRLDRD